MNQVSFHCYKTRPAGSMRAAAATRPTSSPPKKELSFDIFTFLTSLVYTSCLACIYTYKKKTKKEK